MKKNIISSIFALILAHLISPSANAQSTEEQLQDIFVTAGYTAAFGAALGAASLAFWEYPEDHLKDVAVGASLGFIGGSIFGTYIVLSPMLVSNSSAEQNLMATNTRKQGASLAIRPVLDSKPREVRGLGAGFSLNFN